MNEFSKPLNDIFEGLADLLSDNGQIIRRTCNANINYEHPDKNEKYERWFINYDCYNYVVTYVNGDLVSIERIERVEVKEDEN